MDISLTDAVTRAASHAPDACATIFRGRRRSFAEFERRVAEIAASLLAAGIGEGEVVPVLALNSDEYLAVLYAVAWAGAVVCPLNYRWSEPELAAALALAESRILLVGRGFEAMAASLARTRSLALAALDDGAVVSGPGPIVSLTGAAPAANRRPAGDDLYGLFFTGGTTGTPKGVMLGHRALWMAAAGIMAEGDIPARTTYLRALPMFHVGDGAWSLATLLRAGAHVILDRLETSAWLNAVETERVTACGLVPTALQAICADPSLPGRDLSSLRSVLYGGAPFSEAGLQAVRTALPGVALSQGYGMTEYASMMTHLPPACHQDGSALLRSAGRPNAWTELRIVSADGHPAPAGATGEIQVRGPQTMLGYWRSPELTAEAIRDGWLCTGDLGYRDPDGFVFIVDRLKDMIVTGGENVYSTEVEHALSFHPAVSRAAVIGIPSARWGESVHAVIVREPGADVTEAELAAHCAARIARFKCPRSIEFRDDLPLTSFGKIAKQELKASYRSAPS